MMTSTESGNLNQPFQLPPAKALSNANEKLDQWVRSAGWITTGRYLKTPVDIYVASDPTFQEWCLKRRDDGRVLFQYKIHPLPDGKSAWISEVTIEPGELVNARAYLAVADQLARHGGIAIDGRDIIGKAGRIEWPHLKALKLARTNEAEDFTVSFVDRDPMAPVVHLMLVNKAKTCETCQSCGVSHDRQAA